MNYNSLCIIMNQFCGERQSRDHNSKTQSVYLYRLLGASVDTLISYHDKKRKKIILHRDLNHGPLKCKTSELPMNYCVVTVGLILGDTTCSSITLIPSTFMHSVKTCCQLLQWHEYMFVGPRVLASKLGWKVILH